MKTCEAEGQGYQYRQFCKQYSRWCKTNKESMHITAVSGQKMEVDFAGKTFRMVDHLTGELLDIVVFVAVLPYSQYIYTEGMTSTREPRWIAVNNHALQYFGGVPALVVCDNCKQAMIANRDWIAPELNRDYAEWAEHNHTLILPAKIKKPKYKSSVENAVGILDKGIFHDILKINDKVFDITGDVQIVLQVFTLIWRKGGELNCKRKLFAQVIFISKAFAHIIVEVYRASL